MRAWTVISSATIVIVVAAVGGYFLLRSEAARLPETATTGADPQLPAPAQLLIPTVDIPPAKGWSKDERPTPATAAPANPAGSSHVPGGNPDRAPASTETHEPPAK
jgi:hypothetical protein